MLIENYTADGSKYCKVKSQPLSTATTYLKIGLRQPHFSGISQPLIKASHKYVAKYDLGLTSLKAFILNMFTNQKRPFVKLFGLENIAAE